MRYPTKPAKLPLLAVAPLLFLAAVSTSYVALTYAPHRLAAWVSLFGFTISLAGFSCWLMPLEWRKAWFVAWLSFNIAWRVLAHLTHFSPAAVDGLAWAIGGIFDLLIVIIALLSILPNLQRIRIPEILRFLSFVIVPTAGICASLTIWSGAVPAYIAAKAKELTGDKPYCLTSNERLIENAAELSGISLLRSRYYVGPGAGFSFPIYSRYYAVLAIGTENTMNYWNWSFGKGMFSQVDNPNRLWDVYTWYVPSKGGCAKHTSRSEESDGAPVREAYADRRHSR